MAARRLIVVMLVLLGLSTIVAALVPPPNHSGGGPGTTTGPGRPTKPKPPPEPGPAGPTGLVSARLEVARGAPEVVHVKPGQRGHILNGRVADLEIANQAGVCRLRRSRQPAQKAHLFFERGEGETHGMQVLSTFACAQLQSGA